MAHRTILTERQRNDLMALPADVPNNGGVLTDGG